MSKTEGTTQQGGQHLLIMSKMGGTTQRRGTNLFVVSKMGGTTQWGGTNLLVVSKMWIMTQRGGQHLLVASKMEQTTQQGGRNLLVALFVVTVGSIATCSCRWCCCPHPRPRHLQVVSPSLSLLFSAPKAADGVAIIVLVVFSTHCPLLQLQMVL